MGAGEWSTCAWGKVYKRAKSDMPRARGKVRGRGEWSTRAWGEVYKLTKDGMCSANDKVR